MIRFEVTELSDEKYFNLTPSLARPTYGVAPKPYSARATRVTVCVGDGLITSSHERRAGSAPVHGSKVYGTMRDKEVSHLNASGTITLPASTLIWSYDSDLQPLAKSPTSTLIPISAPKYWGDETWFEWSIPSYEYTVNSIVYHVDASYYRMRMRYDDDVAILVSEQSNPRVYKVATNTTVVAASTKSSIDCYRREGQPGAMNLRWWTTYYTKIGTFSGSEQLAYLASLHTKTGGQTLSHLQYVANELGDHSWLVDTLLERINPYLSDVSLHLDEHPADFGELGLECSSQLKFVDQNSLLLILDVGDWKSFHKMWKDFVSLEGWKRAKRFYLKAKRNKAKLQDLPELFDPASSMYLFGKYAVLPTVSDCKRLLAGAQRSSLFLSKQRLHSRRVTSIDDPNALVAQHTAVLTVECAGFSDDISGNVMQFIADGKKWGLYPEVENLWDILTLSFVVDWFVQFGDLFQDVNAYLDQKYYFPIKYCVMSEKWRVDRSITSIAPGYQAEGVVQFSYYTRWISRELPLPTVSLSTESLVGNHLLESTALILQRL